ncbi:hypothetical protein GN958_ATG23536 [Phytophthora infestans]|uniref:Uncharacterized protein n=1 Tax=Phytophthora infestans TaxID=4787 RepID=A0A8S9TIT6_PHYIN|nr:hypothetical protein GN958_ATG23536 [Phytophthora infestans]
MGLAPHLSANGMTAIQHTLACTDAPTYNIEANCWNGGDSGDTRDIEPLAYQQEPPRSAASVQSEKPSQTTAWRPPSLALVSTHVGFEEPGDVLVEWSLDLWNCPERIEISATSSERVMEHAHAQYA